jgi:predicted AlkP superfamily pyrophosphatase or phosphodiesterase
MDRGLERMVNLIVVSDHGMARLDPRQVIYLDDYVEPESFDLIDKGAWLGLAPLRGMADDIYRRLRSAHPRLTIYRRSELPAKYHYRDHPRIPPIIGVVDEGWTVTTRSAAALRTRVSLGDHGYPPEQASMRAIFLARGPAFRKGAVVEPFRSIHIYPLLAHLLELRPLSSDAALDSVKAVLVPSF